MKLTKPAEPTGCLKASYDETQDALALLQILARGEADIHAGRSMPLQDAFATVRRDALLRQRLTR